MNTAVFDGVGELYDMVRPSYPDSLFDYLQKHVGINANSVIADIGSGTGILTEKLLDISKSVFAVEPNLDMRKVSNNKLDYHSHYVSIIGTAEETNLRKNSVDFVTAAQSFHWFNRVLFKKECKRILKSDGTVVLIWNCRDIDSELVQEIDIINQKYCPTFSGFNKGMRGAVGNNDYTDFFDGKYDTKTFKNDIIFDSGRFIGLHNSASYRLNKNDINYINYVCELQNFFDNHNKNGYLIMPNLTKCYTGKV